MANTKHSPRLGIRKRRRDTGVRLTERDITILTWISGTYGSASLLADLTESSRCATRNRLGQLARAGLIIGISAPFGNEKLWLPTQAGLDALRVTKSGDPT